MFQVSSTLHVHPSLPIDQLRVLYAHSKPIGVAPPVLPRLLAQVLDGAGLYVTHAATYALVMSSKLTHHSRSPGHIRICSAKDAPLLRTMYPVLASVECTAITDPYPS
jgi:hypothetical protein